jgi:NAD(P)-dependent dehydrogenase (short-subunit alcohol dehydrogenase family)
MDRVVFITGASSGIGEALAREHHRRGDRLVLVARRVERLESLAAELGGPSRCLAVAGDVTARADLDAAVARAEAAFGGVDVVYANAGFGVDGRFEDLSADDFRRQFETNVFGVLHTAWAALEALTRRRGVFAVVGSVAGFLAAPGSPAYSMSKYAVRAFAEGMDHEWRARGVAVVHIAPGFVASEIRRVDRRGTLHDTAKDPAPAWLVMPAETAARQMADAVARRRPLLVVTAHGKLGVALTRWAPGLVRVLFRAAGGKVKRKGTPEVPR